MWHKAIFHTLCLRDVVTGLHTIFASCHLTIYEHISQIHRVIIVQVTQTIRT